MPRNSVFVAFTFSLAAVSSALSQNVSGPTDAALASRADSLFSRYANARSPGVSVAVVRNGKTVFAKGYGLAELEDQVPITSSTVFDVGSIAKQFTGLAVAMLVAQNRIKLDADVATYIPQLNLGRPVTVDELLHHTSGLRDWPATLGLAGWRMDDVITTDHILNFAYRQHSLNFTPGSEYSYSNTGYVVLAEIIKRVTGTPFPDWMDQNVFRPLGMINTQFRSDPSRLIPRRAFGYGQNKDSTFRVFGNNLAAPGSSSLFTTAEDMAKWIANFDSRTVGGQAIDLMQTRGSLANGKSLDYGFGIEHGEYRGVPMLWHDGGWQGFTSAVVYLPKVRGGVVVLANTPIDPVATADQLMDIFFADALGAPSAPPERQAPPANASTPSVNLSPNTLDQYAGVYRLAPAYYITISRSADGLTAQATGESPVPIVPRSESEFWISAYRSAITFARDRSGKVTQFVLRGSTAPRMVDRPAPSSQLSEYVGEYYSPELETSYFVEQRDSSLYMRHPRRGGGTLTRAWGDDFHGSVVFLTAVEFQRDKAGHVTGLRVTPNDLSRNVIFVKR